MQHEKVNTRPPGNQLEERLQNKLNELRSVEQDLPGVIIIHDIRTSSVVYMSPRGLQELGTNMEELNELGEEYFYRFFNADDAKDYVPKIIKMVQRNNDEEMVSFFQQVRPSGAQEFIWHLSSSKIFLRDENGLPAYTITISIPIDAQHHLTAKVERLLQENNFLRSNQQTFDALSKREKEVLRLLALGNNSMEIAKALFISETTAKTHRRNIRRKLNAQSGYDLTRFAQAFNLI